MRLTFVGYFSFLKPNGTEINDDCVHLFRVLALMSFNAFPGEEVLRYFQEPVSSVVSQHQAGDQGTKEVPPAGSGDTSLKGTPLSSVTEGHAATFLPVA